MIKVFKKILMHSWRLLKLEYSGYSRKKIISKSTRVKLVNESQQGEIVFTVKNAGIEKIPLSYVIEHIEGGEIAFQSPQIDLKNYSNAIVFAKSDFIIIGDKAIWHKSSMPQFTKFIPADKYLLDYQNDTLYIDKPCKIIDIKNGFSLCGVHSNTWAHFLVQYFPKIDYIEKLLNIINDELTIIVPVYKDHQIKEIINAYCNKVNRLNIVELQDDEIACCKNLYHIENLSFISDHADYLSPSDLIVPNMVVLFLKEKFLSNIHLFPSSLNYSSSKKRKLFIVRSGYRNILNIDEIEVFFRSEGFEFINPQDYSLDEKRMIFQEALIIVGPGSSGFTNAIFCKPGTIILAFVNFQRIYDLYMSSIVRMFDLRFFLLTGTDINPASPHSAFFIPIEKIKKEYYSIINSQN